MPCRNKYASLRSVYFLRGNFYFYRIEWRNSHESILQVLCCATLYLVPLSDVNCAFVILTLLAFAFTMRYALVLGDFALCLFSEGKFVIQLLNLAARTEILCGERQGATRPLTLAKGTNPFGIPLCFAGLLQYAKKLLA